MRTASVRATAWGTCPDCIGTLLMVDDGSVSGAPGAPIPCACTPDHSECLSWTRSMWDQYRARMDAGVRQWIAFYGLPGSIAWPVDNAVETNSATSGTIDSREVAA